MATWNDFWNETVEDFSRIYPIEAGELGDNPVARLVGRMPFIVGSRNPHRHAVEHLAVFVTWWMRNKQYDAGTPLAYQPYINQQPGDTMRDRFVTITAFSGGDPRAVKSALDLYELISLMDHHIDRDRDEKDGKHNPLLAGEVEFDARAGVLRARIQSSPTWPLMQEAMALADGPYDLGVQDDFDRLIARARWWV